MNPRRRAAFGLRAALTFFCAVLVHGAIHASGDPSFLWDSPAHLVMLATALSLLAAIVAPLVLAGSIAERRRRLALVRTALGARSWASTAASAAAQGALAVVLLGADDAAIAPDRVAATVGCAIVALVCATFVPAAAARRIVAVLCAFVAAGEAAGARRSGRPAPDRVADAALLYRLFVPTRPPPLAL